MYQQCMIHLYGAPVYVFCIILPWKTGKFSNAIFIWCLLVVTHDLLLYHIEDSGNFLAHLFKLHGWLMWIAFACLSVCLSVCDKKLRLDNNFILGSIAVTFLVMMSIINLLSSQVMHVTCANFKVAFFTTFIAEFVYHQSISWWLSTLLFIPNQSFTKLTPLTARQIWRWLSIRRMKQSPFLRYWTLLNFIAFL